MLEFNATVNSKIVIDTVLFQFSNGTNPFNATAVNNSGTWNVSVNVSEMAEAVHTVTVFANDSLGNTNFTESIIITIDRTAPNITQINFTTDGGAICSYPENCANTTNSTPTFELTLNEIGNCSISTEDKSYDDSGVVTEMVHVENNKFNSDQSGNTNGNVSILQGSKVWWVNEWGPNITIACCEPDYLLFNTTIASNATHGYYLNFTYQFNNTGFYIVKGIGASTYYGNVSVGSSNNPCISSGTSISCTQDMPLSLGSHSLYFTCNDSFGNFNTAPLPNNHKVNITIINITVTNITTTTPSYPWFDLNFVLPQADSTGGQTVYSLGFETNASGGTVTAQGVPTVILSANGSIGGIVAPMVLSMYDNQNPLVKNYFGAISLPMIYNRSYGLLFMLNTSVSAGQAVDIPFNLSEKMEAYSVNWTLFEHFNNQSLLLTVGTIYGGIIEFNSTQYEIPFYVTDYTG
jgi:hypothetical protein